MTESEEKTIVYVLNHKIRHDLTFLRWTIEDFINFKPMNMVEIGSRDGRDTAEISDAYKIPPENCHVFEPVPHLCEQISIAFPNFKVFNNAVSCNTGKRTFRIDKDNVGASSLLVRKDGSNVHELEVECVNMEGFFDAMNLQSVDVCKIDVEGSALDVLKSFGHTISKVKVIQLECEHKAYWEGQDLYDEVEKFLKDKGFHLAFFVCPSDLQSDSVWVKKECLK